MAGVVVKAHFKRRRMVKVVAANLFRHLVQGSSRSWVRNIGSTAPALGSMTLLLVMAGLVGLTGFALYNLDRVETAQASVLQVYLRDNATPDEIAALRDLLTRDPRVASITYTTKAQALQRAQTMPGLPQLAGATDSNPFPASFSVKLKSIDDVGAIDAIVRSDVAVDPAYPTSYDQGAYQRIQAVLFGVAVAGISFLTLLGFVAVMVTVNSIKAAIIARRDEIAIMQLVGAPRWMVRGPFVMEGAITGAMAGAIAGVVTFGLAATAIQAGSQGFTQFAPGVTVVVAAVAAALVFVTGLFLGSGSSMLGMRRHMES